MSKELLNELFNPNHLIGALVLGVAFVVVGVVLSRLVRRVLNAILTHNHSERLDEIALSFLSHLCVLIIWVLLITAYAHLVPALNRLGTALLAGVSVASVVVGFAAQSTLSNLVAGISLVLYKPFRRGDRLQISAPASGGNQNGIVQDISLGYTVLRADDGRDIIIANATMAQQTMIRLPATPPPAAGAASAAPTGPAPVSSTSPPPRQP